MGKLRVQTGSTPLRAEHRRLLRTALKRGTLQPERRAEDRLEGRYSKATLESARAVWLQRMLHEHQSAAVFSRLLPQLIEAEATLDVKTSVLRMAMDELHHASLCGDVVEFLGGVAEVEASLATEPLPEHPDATPLERALRNVLFVGCLSETIALAFLTEERAGTQEPYIDRVLTQLGADEVLHAKLGWAYVGEVLPKLDAPARERTRRYLPVALGAIEQRMLHSMPLAPPGERDRSRALAPLGILPARVARELLYDTLGQVILPQLAAMGFDVAGAWEARARGARVHPNHGRRGSAPQTRTETGASARKG